MAQSLIQSTQRNHRSPAPIDPIDQLAAADAVLMNNQRLIATECFCDSKRSETALQ